jgi:hypothetical protein
MIFDRDFSKVNDIRGFRDFHYKYDGPKTGFGFHNPNDEYVDIDMEYLKLNKAIMTTYASVHYGEEYEFEMVFKCDDTEDNVLSIADIDIVLNMENNVWYRVKINFSLPTYEEISKEERKKVKQGNVEVFLTTENNDAVDYVYVTNWNEQDVGFITLGSEKSRVLYKRIKLSRESTEEPDINIPYTEKMALEIIKENL